MPQAHVPPGRYPRRDIYDSRKLSENSVYPLFLNFSSPVVRAQLALCHPSYAAGINVFLHSILKTTLEVPRICHFSEKMLQREGPRAGPWPQTPNLSCHQRPEVEGDLGTASQGYRVYRSLPANQHMLVRIPTHCNSGCKSSCAPKPSSNNQMVLFSLLFENHSKDQY